MTDIEYMHLALECAAKGAGFVNPNPQVGCVIVKDGEIIGKGWHREYGNLHAEREALASCTSDPKGATAYVTLEPCCHQGKQPPCTEALIEAGISKVVMGSHDPNPLVSGKGIAQFKEAGIEVVEGVLESECNAINKEWLFYIQNQMPYVTMKYAMTLDGKIATSTGDSKWVTGSEARARVHQDRAKASAIVVGVGTVLADDPLLTARIDGETPHQPARIVVDCLARTPLESQLVLTAFETPTYIVTEPDAPASRAEALHDMGCKIMRVPAQDGRIDLKMFFKDLADKGMSNVIVEGGGTLHGSLLASGCINRVQAYIATKIIGGKAAPSPVEGSGIPIMDMAQPLSNVTVTKLGDDLLVEGEVR